MGAAVVGECVGKAVPPGSGKGVGAREGNPLGKRVGVRDGSGPGQY